MAGPGTPYTTLDANQVLQQSFDQATDRLRVDASVTATIGDVTINATESDIAIADRVTGYLYNPKTGGIDNASGVTFNIYRVEDINTPQWNDLFITTIPGVLQSNSYYFTDASISSLTGAILDGDTTLMIEGVATRSGTTYRDRIYVNHLGVYQSVVSLRQAVDFLDITKKDIIKKVNELWGKGYDWAGISYFTLRFILYYLFKIPFPKKKRLAN